MGSSTRRKVFPFAAVVGQETVKTALMIAAVNPDIGGVLISGLKGTGKSTIVRALSEILPQLKRVKGCPYGCNPEDPNLCPDCRQALERAQLETIEEPMKIVQVPIGSTDERVLGSMNFEEASKGNKLPELGLLARAHRNFLFVDNVNLLPDHLVDCILDASATGWNLLERDNIKLEHPAKFTLLGTMTWEEGDLRPQILDRFGIHAETSALNTPEQRAILIERTEQFQKDPRGFYQEFLKQTASIRERIQHARDLLGNTKINDESLNKIIQICANLKVDGHRPDIVMTRG